ncbi:methyltransferase [Acidovorax sp. SRB_24]|uniref:class I SAM-dependent methyltransferase n=1 Tax=Acidovorax sp. SRB_24 TaxID=1962700 RepID=UPI00145D5429|nr:SAM-dependent methyltransferase [Acidovorax sp. SRB_24]NMM76663.1 SAM-dependent methyltransferase [Acidovorax sp. SRB_24]
MPGYLLKFESIAVRGVDNLAIRSLRDHQQFSDPLGAAQRLGISSAAWPLFGLLWPSGLHMAERMALHPVTPGERILEIGCGLALASLVAHRRGADVTASDCHPLAGDFLRENLRLNQMSPMPYRHGQWGVPADAGAAGQVQGLFDLVLGSDLLYERDEDGTLARFIGAHTAPRGQVWIIDPDRGNRPAFTRRMAAQGFGLREERLQRPAEAGMAAYKGRVLVYGR